MPGEIGENLSADFVSCVFGERADMSDFEPTTSASDISATVTEAAREQMALTAEWYAVGERQFSIKRTLAC